MKILKVLTPRRLIGNKGERAASAYLKKSGYKILEKNYVALDTEIDIIAQNCDYLVFVEVKTRTEKDGEEILRPALAVTPEKQRKILNCAKFYSRFAGCDKMLRFDIIEVFMRNGKINNINHMEGAFNGDSAKVKRK